MSDSFPLDTKHLPRHIAIIMDGNGRWAKERGLPRIVGHKNGVLSVRKVVRAARELGIDVLTLYAFSTENWKRPPKEVQVLMGLLKSFLQSELTDMLQEDICLRCIGQKEKLPKDVNDILDDVIMQTQNADGMILNLALSYGGRSEIVMAVQEIAKKISYGTLKPEAIDEKVIADHLYTTGLPDPDLVIRTGGESRLSNFLLWQASYAEIYITESKWPDFDKDSLHQAIYDYQQRQRRFGKTGDQVEKELEA